MIIDVTWRDGLTLLGLLFGGVSLWWGFRQTQLARNAQDAEREVREDLYRHQVTQRVSQLSISLIKVYSLVKERNYAYAAESAWDLISDFSHAAGYSTPESLGRGTRGIGATAYGM
jgi:hypothetical protein